MAHRFSALGLGPPLVGSDMERADGRAEKLPSLLGSDENRARTRSGGERVESSMILQQKQKKGTSIILQSMVVYRGGQAGFTQPRSHTIA